MLLVRGKSMRFSRSMADLSVQLNTKCTTRWISWWKGVSTFENSHPFFLLVSMYSRHEAASISRIVLALLCFQDLLLCLCYPPWNPFTQRLTLPKITMTTIWGDMILGELTAERILDISRMTYHESVYISSLVVMFAWLMMTTFRDHRKEILKIIYQRLGPASSCKANETYHVSLK